MSEHANNAQERKYPWVAKWAKMTGERAMIDAKVHDTYIVYKDKDGHLVKKYSNGNIVKVDDEKERRKAW
jgi:hypothetical protein